MRRKIARRHRPVEFFRSSFFTGREKILKKKHVRKLNVQRVFGSLKKFEDFGGEDEIHVFV